MVSNSEVGQNIGAGHSVGVGGIDLPSSCLNSGRRFCSLFESRFCVEMVVVEAYGMSQGMSVLRHKTAGPRTLPLMEDTADWVTLGRSHSSWWFACT